MTEPGVKQAVILAGGAGTRLASRLNGLPKPLVDVDGVPLLGRQLQQLAAHGFGEVVVLVNFKAAAIEAFCAKHAPNRLKIRVIDDGEKPRGTAGATYDARWALAERFAVVYGDTLFDIDFARFWRAHEVAHKHGACATLFLHPNDHPHDSDLVAVGPGGFITAFYPKPHSPQDWRRNLVNAALYVIEREALEAVAVPDGIVDFGRDFFPAAVRSGCRLNSYHSFEYIKDVGTPDRLDQAVLDLRSGKVSRARLTSLQKAVFLDRDGTLNKPAGHIATPDRLELTENAGEAVRALNRAEYRCVLVTNQPVVARGECTEAMLDVIHAKLETLLGNSGAFLDASYVCPHHTDSGFPGERPELKFRCECRKPRPGMINQAIADLHIDRSRSWMIGDSDADVGAARAGSVTSILLLPPDAARTARQYEPDFEASSLLQAVSFILHGYPALRSALRTAVDAVQAGQNVSVAGDNISNIRAAATTIRYMLEERGLACEHVTLGGCEIRRGNRAPTSRDDSNAAPGTTTGDGAPPAVTIVEMGDRLLHSCSRPPALNVWAISPAHEDATQTRAESSCAAAPTLIGDANGAASWGDGIAHLTITMPARHILP